MWRKITVTTLLFMAVIGTASGVSTSIKASCDTDEVDLVSINSTTGGHIAEPGYYGNEVCVEGLVESEIKQGCLEDENRAFSMFDRTNSHFTIYSIYRYDICLTGLESQVASTCSKGTAAFSVDSDNNSHVAAPGYYSNQLCLFRQPPENVTVELSGLSGSFYADDNTLSTGDTVRIAEYPYAVSEDSGMTSGIVSYGDMVSISRPSGDTVELTQSSGSFLMPYIQGNVDEIEDEQEMVNSRSFLERLSPSFSYTIPDKPTVRVILQPDENVEGFGDTLRNDIEIAVKNGGLVNDALLIKMKGD